jgi:hypothetical protein
LVLRNQARECSRGVLLGEPRHLVVSIERSDVADGRPKDFASQGLTADLVLGGGVHHPAGGVAITGDE